MEILAKSYGYDHQAKKKELQQSLNQVGRTLVETISVESTQAFVAFNGKSGHAVLAFRGTEADRIGDIRADVRARHAICPTGGLVHEGFHTHYNDAESEILRVLDDKQAKRKPLFITGHRLGGAVATIATRRLTEDHRIAACYTFGSPRVGTEEWVWQIKSPIYQIINSADPVPSIPFSKTTTAFAAKGIRAIGRLIPWVGAGIVWFGQWIEKQISGYEHADNMRHLTNCKDGDLSRAELLYTVGWGRRFLAVVMGALPRKKLISDHGIATYQMKLLQVAKKRNLE